jgi:hypothetical protein
VSLTFRKKNSIPATFPVLEKDILKFCLSKEVNGPKSGNLRQKKNILISILNFALMSHSKTTIGKVG